MPSPAFPEYQMRYWRSRSSLAKQQKGKTKPSNEFALLLELAWVLLTSTWTGPTLILAVAWTTVGMFM